MQIDSISVKTQSLQNSDNNRLTTVDKPVVQDSNQKNEKDSKQDGKITADKVETAVQKLNDFIEPLRTNLKFEYHDKLHEYYVTIVNQKTKEVLKEIPSKKMLDIYAAMADYMGFLIDEKI